MKKYVFVLAVFLLAGVVSKAQRVNKFGIGINAGITSTKPTGGDFNSANGFVGGISGTIPLSNDFFLQPEVNFQQHNADVKGYVGIGDLLLSGAHLKLNYLNVPVLLKFKFPSTHLSIYAGPQAGFKLSSKMKIDNLEKFDYTPVRSFDFGGVYGLEYFFLVTPNSAIVLNARYKTGFTKLLRDDAYLLNDNKTKLNAFAFTLGYRF